MIDTIRFRGPVSTYTRPWTFGKYFVFRSEDGDWERIPVTLIENKKDAKKRSVYRVFHTPTTEIMDVEINVGKLLLEHNIYNYLTRVNDINSLVRAVGRAFFHSGTYYVTRVDLGHVQTFETANEAKACVEKYRKSRLPGSYSRKYKHQNYADSVHYKSENWSIKIYNKYAEMVHNLGVEVANEILPNNNMVRFEKTYRVGEMSRLGLYADAYKGVHIDAFDAGKLVADYRDVFERWEFATIPHLTNAKGVIGLISILDNVGLLSEIEGTSVVSRSSVHRYKKDKKKFVVNNPVLQIVENISPAMKQKVSYAVNVGISNLLPL